MDINLRKRLKLLIAMRYYQPGYLAGGPVRSVTNLVSVLGREYDFRIVCLDRDLRGATPYPNVKLGHWQPRGAGHVMYVRPCDVGRRLWQRVAAEQSPDMLYLNSLFDPSFTLSPWLTLGRKLPVLIAPRGELSPGALSLKRVKKELYLRFLKWSRMTIGVHWHASSDTEQAHLLQNMHVDARFTYLAADLPDQLAVSQRTRNIKRPGYLRIVFLSRVTPMKNLHTAIAIASRLTGVIAFDIWGPQEDMAYARHCKTVIDACSSNMRVNWRGSLPHENVCETLANYDVLLLPTLGENFGHIILESLSAGLPTVISDQTPWRKLHEAGVGADLPLNDSGAFVRVLEHYRDMGESKMANVRAVCSEYVSAWRKNNINLDDYRRMFSAVSASRVRGKEC